MQVKIYKTNPETKKKQKQKTKKKTVAKPEQQKINMHTIIIYKVIYQVVHGYTYILISNKRKGHIKFSSEVHYGRKKLKLES